MRHLSGDCNCFDPERVSLDHSDTFASSVKQVFSRVCTASDKKENRFPSLFITDQQELSSCVFETGEIQISKGTLNYLYQKHIPIEVSEARLAFILGHEMAHAAYHSFKKNTFMNMNKTVLQKQMAKIELEADRYGILFATFAGFQPEFIIDYNGTNFIQEWEIINQLSHYTTMNSHPNPFSRKKQLQTIAKETKMSLDLFHAATKLYIIGRFREALACLKKFAVFYPSREVFNNIGTCYLQLYIQQYNPLNQFVLPAMIDTKSRADLFKYRTRYHSDALVSAKKYFDKAIKRDPYYLVSGINLSTTFLLMEDTNNAKAILKPLVKKIKNPHIHNNYAILLWIQNHKQSHPLIIHHMEKAVSMNDAYCQNLDFFLPSDTMKSLPKKCRERNAQTEHALLDFYRETTRKNKIEKIMAQEPYNEFIIQDAEMKLAFYSHQNKCVLTINGVPVYIELKDVQKNFLDLRSDFGHNQLIQLSSPAQYISFDQDHIVVKMMDGQINGFLFYDFGFKKSLTYRDE